MKDTRTELYVGKTVRISRSSSINPLRKLEGVCVMTSLDLRIARRQSPASGRQYSTAPLGSRLSSSRADRVLDVEFVADVSYLVQSRCLVFPLSE